MSRSLALILVLVVLLAGSGCSRVGFAYGQAERFIAWTLDSYIPLDDRQSAALDRQLADFKQWHCRTQVAGYAAWLRQAGTELREGVAATQVEARFANVRFFGRVMAEEAGPRLAGLARSLTDKQLDELSRSMERSNRKFREDFVDVAYPRVAAARAERTRERLEFWVGPLGSEQRLAVQRWSDSLEPSQVEMLASRERWQKALQDALRARRQEHESLPTRLQDLLGEPDRWTTPALQATLERNRARTFAMVAELSALMTPSQKRRVAEKTASVAADLEALACPVPARKTAGVSP